MDPLGQAAWAPGELPDSLWSVPDVDVSWCARSLDEGVEIGFEAERLVTPASTMKVQVALAAASAMDAGRLDGAMPVRLEPATRTPGPVGISLLSDAVVMSLRDLLVPMLTVSDNVATDALIEAVGLDAINALTTRLGLVNTRVASTLRGMLDELGQDAGFNDYAGLVFHDPARHGPPSSGEVTTKLESGRALDPVRGSCTTASDMVRLLSMIWNDTAGPADACATVRRLMARQVTRHRIASGFGPDFDIAAKSGGLLGVVRNEVGVATDSRGRSFAIGIFTRRRSGSPSQAQDIDAAIGRLARSAVDQLRGPAA